MKESLTQRWESLSPNAKRGIAIGGAMSVLLVISYLFMTATPDSINPGNKNARKRVSDDVLTSANTRELGIDGLNNRTRRLGTDINKMNKRLDKTLKKLEKRQEKAEEENVTEAELKRTLREVRSELKGKMSESADQAAQKAANKAAEKMPEQRPKSTPDKDSSESDADGDKQSKPNRQPPEQQKPDRDIWGKQPRPQGGQPTPQPRDQQNMALDDSDPSQDSSQEKSSKVSDIRVIGEDESKPDAGGNQGDDDEQEDDLYMPAGSIIQAELITGMEAPTNNAARAKPFPALARVDKSAILPNHYRLNVRECFIISSGYGDLSAERAYLRAETLSCVRDDGGVIETSLNAYASGEDGKVGMQGRVVSKKGQLLAKSMAAGFLSGMSKMFSRVPVPTINTNQGSDGNRNVQYQDMLSGDSVTAGAVEGASSALDRLAQNYLDMADQIFPVIEVNAGRDIEFIVSQGGWLKTVNSK